MFLKIFLFLLQGVFNIQACELYFASNDSTTWKSASTKLNFAAPDISYNENNLTLNFNLELGNTNVWIGYFRALTAFEYFGCMREESVNGLEIHKLERNAPGLCFSACGKQLLVGLCLKMCYCFENLPTESHHLQKCNESCPAENDLLCGGDGHISLYKVNNEVQLSRQLFATGDEQCLMLDNTPRLNVRRWEICQKAAKTMCSFENGTILTDYYNFNWKKATEKCFRINGYATHYVNTTFNYDKLPSGTSWTGVILSNVIYKYSEIDVNIFGDIDCGYLEQSQTICKNVVFTNQCDHQWSNLLCRIGTSSTAAPSYVGTSSVSGSKTDTTMIFSNISSGNRSETNHQELQYKGSDVGAIIGASVASVLVVIAAIAVIVIILKRRQNNPCTDQTKLGNLSEQAHYITPVLNREDNRTYINVKYNDTGDTNDGYEIPNSQQSVYESLHDRSNQGHFYETTSCTLHK